MFEQTVVPRDLDLIELPFAERGLPRLVRGDGREPVARHRPVDGLRAHGGRYDELRPASPDLAEVTLAELEGAAGCSTSAAAPAGSPCWRPSGWGRGCGGSIRRPRCSRGRARARARGCGWKQAAAERLPFKDGWFDAVHAHLVLHLVEDRSRAIAEMAARAGRGRPGGDRRRFGPSTSTASTWRRTSRRSSRSTARGFPIPAWSQRELLEAGLDEVSERAVRATPPAGAGRAARASARTLHLDPPPARRGRVPERAGAAGTRHGGANGRGRGRARVVADRRPQGGESVHTPQQQLTAL